MPREVHFVRASPLDVLVIAVYLVGITLFGIRVGYRRGASTDQYFLAGKSLGWFTVGAAVFTSNISTLHLVGLAAGGAKDGLVIGNFEWMAASRSRCSLVVAPFYIRSDVRTLPELMERLAWSDRSSDARFRSSRSLWQESQSRSAGVSPIAG